MSTRLSYLLLGYVRSDQQRTSDLIQTDVKSLATLVSMHTQIGDRMQQLAPISSRGTAQHGVAALTPMNTPTSKFSAKVASLQQRLHLDHLLPISAKIYVLNSLNF